MHKEKDLSPRSGNKLRSTAKFEEKTDDVINIIKSCEYLKNFYQEP